MMSVLWDIFRQTKEKPLVIVIRLVLILVMTYLGA